MYANLCPETVGIPAMSAEELVGLAARHCFGGVDFPLARVRDAAHARDLAHRARGFGLRWGLFWLPCDFPSADEATLAAGMETLRRQLPIVQAAGCTRTYNHVWPGSDELAYAQNFERHVRRLAPVAKLLADHGVTYGLEFLGPHHLRASKRHPFINNVDEMLTLADAVGSGAGVVFDFFHWYTSGGTVSQAHQAIAKAGGGRRIVNVHANDAVPGRTPAEQRDHERAMPLSTGVIDAASIVAMLKEVGYDGPVIVEPFEPARKRLAVLAPDEAAAEVALSLRSVLRLASDDRWRTATGSRPAPAAPPATSGINATTSYAQRATTAIDEPLPFGPTITFNNGPGYLAWTYGDFDGDGDIDIIAARTNWTPQGQAVEFYENRDGVYVRNQDVFDGSPPLVVHGRKAITADLDGDGRPDVVIADHGYDRPPFHGHPATALFNRNGRFEAVNLPLPPGFYHSVCAGDIDGDGDVDLFFTDALTSSTPSGRFLINDGRGNFTYEPDRFPEALRGTAVFTSELYDIDGDGHLDLIIGGHEHESETRILWGDGTGRYTLDRMTILPPVRGYGIVIGFSFVPQAGGALGADIVVNRTNDGQGPHGWYTGFHVQYLAQLRPRAFADETVVRVDRPTSWTGRWNTWLRVHDIDGDGVFDFSSENVDDRTEWLCRNRFYYRSHG